jgi:protein-disulfide isomerase
MPPTHKPKGLLLQGLLESIMVLKGAEMENLRQPETEIAPQVSESPSSAEGYLRIRRSSLIVALLPLTFVLGLASGFLFWGRSTESTIPSVVDSPAQSPLIAEVQEPTRLDVSADDDPALGADDAQVVIIEFSDFSCPFCQRFHLETFSGLMESYADQIQFVYRDFPIVGGGQIGFMAAQAANCAAEQGDYWTFHDALFSGRYGLDEEGFGQYASELGLNSDELITCVQSGRYEEEVQLDFQDGVDLGVTGTPTFFINGIPFVGAQPLANFARVIDAELGG